MERLAKLIIIVDYALINDGNLPDPSLIRKHGHELSALFEKVDEIAATRCLRTRFGHPTDVICSSIIDNLQAFADAKRGRYANFQALGDPNLFEEAEPMRRWWSEVAQPIIERHFSGKLAERRASNRAELLHSVLSHVSSVRHFSEEGGAINNIRDASLRSGVTPYVQRYGRLYTGKIVRWLAEVFEKLSIFASYENRMDVFFGHYEFFSIFIQKDKYILGRKGWP